MTTSFTLHLQSATQYEKFVDIVSFVGRDNSGSFGIMANHTRMMTSVNFGLMHFIHEDSTKEYLALPGGILYFVDDQLFVSTRHYCYGKDYTKIIPALNAKLDSEEKEVKTIKETLNQLDENILKQLWEMRRNS